MSRKDYGAIGVCIGCVMAAAGFALLLVGFALMRTKFAGEYDKLGGWLAAGGFLTGFFAGPFLRGGFDLLKDN